MRQHIKHAGRAIKTAAVVGLTATLGFFGLRAATHNPTSSEIINKHLKPAKGKVVEMQRQEQETIRFLNERLGPDALKIPLPVVETISKMNAESKEELRKMNDIDLQKFINDLVQKQIDKHKEAQKKK